MYHNMYALVSDFILGNKKATRVESLSVFLKLHLYLKYLSFTQSNLPSFSNFKQKHVQISFIYL